VKIQRKEQYFAFIKEYANVRFILDQMYAEICAYLTGSKYFELPSYRVGKFRNSFCLENYVFFC